MLDWLKAIDLPKVLLIFALVVVAAVMWSRSRVKINVEPLENKDKNAKDALEKITRMTDDIQDGLNISSYNETYQDIVLQLDKWAGLRLIEMMKDPESLVKKTVEFNSVSDFKTNLNKAMAVLDKA